MEHMDTHTAHETGRAYGMMAREIGLSAELYANAQALPFYYTARTYEIRKRELDPKTADAVYKILSSVTLEARRQQTDCYSAGSFSLGYYHV